jgi:transcriptional regulator with XRE-family HTH domain
METLTLQERVAEEVRALLARRRMSAHQTAVSLGWTDMYMSRRLNSRAPFDLHDLEALAGLLQVPVAELFGQRDDAPRVLSTVPARSLAGGTTKPNYSTPPCSEMSEMPLSSPSGPFCEIAA